VLEQQQQFSRYAAGRAAVAAAEAQEQEEEQEQQQQQQQQQEGARGEQQQQHEGQLQPVVPAGLMTFVPDELLSEIFLLAVQVRPMLLLLVLLLLRVATLAAAPGARADVSPSCRRPRPTRAATPPA